MKKVVTAQQAKNNARWMDIGTIIAVLLPFPLLIFWFGAAILVYAMNRHHPNQKVGVYIQAATTRFYAVMGVIVVIGTIIPLQNALTYWFALWSCAVIFLIIPSIYSLVKIQKEDWQDVEYDLNIGTIPLSNNG